MSQVEELLNSLSETFPEHTHPVVDSDNYFVIDPVTRIIKNMTNGPLVIMQRDHKSTVYTFQLPRYIDGHDMSLCNRVKCHFNNVENNEEDDSLIEHADVAELTDLRVNPDDRNTVVCSWIITRQATQYAGALGFFIQYLCVDNEGNETYEWHTDEFVEVIVKKTKHNDEQAIVEYTAIFEQWRERIFGAGDSVKSEMIALTEEKLRAIENKGTEQAAKVTNEGLRVLDTIPEDYTAMSEQVRMLSRFAGPVIRQEREGKTIAVKDSAKIPLLGLQMFGKSKQKTTIGKNILDTSMSNSISLNGYENFNSINDVISITNTALFGFKIPVEYGVNYSLSLDKLVVDAVFHFRVYEYSAEPITIDPNAEVNYLQTAINESCASKNRVEKQYTPTSDAVKWIAVGFYTDKTNTLSNLQMEIGTEVTEFEPYTGGKPSPNPEYPQKIASVGRVRNLLQIQAESETIAGISYTVNDDGSITANGTATGSAFYILNEGTLMEAGKEYILSGCPKGGDKNTTYQMYVENISVRDIGEGVTFLINETASNRVVILIREGFVADNLTFYPMLREADIADPTYYPYTGKPVIPTYICGKNLFRNSLDSVTTLYGLTKTMVSGMSEIIVDGVCTNDHSCMVSIIDMVPGKYILSVTGLNRVTSNSDRVYLKDQTQNKVIVNYVMSDDPKTFEITENTTVEVHVVFANTSSYDNSAIKLQIEKGTEATDYESYIDRQLLSSSIELPGLPVETGGNYVDKNGQQYIANYRDWERGVDVQNIFVKTYNNSESEKWYLGGGSGDGIDNRFEIGEAVGSIINTKYFAIEVAMSDSYIYDRTGGTPKTNHFRVGCNGANTCVYVMFNPDTSIVPLEDLEAWKEFIQDHPITVYIPLSEPIETPIPEAELQAYRELHLNYPNTTILNDSEAYMKLAYATDTKMYIDNKFAELQALIKES